MLKFLFWDVQHGSAAFITTPNKRRIVVDLGAGIYGSERPFSPVSVLRANGLLDELDLLIITHPHADHIADIDSLSGLKVRDLITPPIPEAVLAQTAVNAGPEFDTYRNLVASFDYPMPFSFAGSRVHDWDGVKITSFFPNCQSSNINDYSAVMLFEYSDTKLLLAGDNEECSWRALLEERSFVKAIRGIDVLVAPHHGRQSGFYPPLFEVIHPKITIISDGPLQDTSATERYSAVTSGWKVRAGSSSEKRKCVTSRCDGNILVEFRDAFFIKDFNIAVEKTSASAPKFSESRRIRI